MNVAVLLLSGQEKGRTIFLKEEEVAICNTGALCGN
jgi:hypothetical protein